MSIAGGRHLPCRPPAFYRMTSRIMVDPTLLGPVKSCRVLTQSITVHELTGMNATTVAQTQLGIRRRLPVLYCSL